MIYVNALFLTGCSPFHNSGSGSSSQPESSQAFAAAATVPATNSHGYALLFELVHDEKDISKLRFIKRERPELKALLQEIARVNRDASDRLEKFAKANRQLNLKDNGLPSAEIQSRQAISKFKENAILHSKDKELEVQLLLSENEALTYGSHLAGTVARTETDPQRRHFLEQLSTALTGLQQKVVQTLATNYSWPQPTAAR